MNRRILFFHTQPTQHGCPTFSYRHNNIKTGRSVFVTHHALIRIPFKSVWYLLYSVDKQLKRKHILISSSLFPCCRCYQCHHYHDVSSSSSSSCRSFQHYSASCCFRGVWQRLAFCVVRNKEQTEDVRTLMTTNKSKRNTCVAVKCY